jgi:hypothetical protein
MHQAHKERANQRIESNPKWPRTGPKNPSQVPMPKASPKVDEQNLQVKKVDKMSKVVQSQAGEHC